METKRFNRYSYAELLPIATAHNAKQIDIDTLGAWFEQYGMDFWNGEYFDADGHRLYRVEKWDEENDQGEVVGYEFR